MIKHIHPDALSKQQLARLNLSNSREFINFLNNFSSDELISVDIIRDFFASSKKGKLSKVISFANHKGGVGKTELCFNFGLSAHLLGYSVLFIDADSQGNLTRRFLSSIGNNKSIWDIYNDPNTSLEDITFEVKKDVFLTPANENIDQLHDFFAPLNWLRKRLSSNDSVGNPDGAITDREKRLADELTNVKKYFDFILIDTKPNLTRTNRSIFLGTDIFIVPCELDPESIDAAENLSSEVARTWKYINRVFKEEAHLKIVLNRFQDADYLINDINRITERFPFSISSAVIPPDDRTFQTAKRANSTVWGLSQVPTSTACPFFDLVKEVSSIHSISQERGKHV